MLKKLKNFFTKEETATLSYSYTGIIRFVPLIVTGGFFLCTILLVAFGPLDWHIYNNFKFYGFTLACLVALVTGYILSVYIKSPTAKRQPMKIDMSKVLIVCSVIALLLYFPTVKVNTGKWYPDIYTGITNTGLAYRIAKYYSEFAPKSLFYLRMLVSPILMLIMPVTFFYKSTLTKTAFSLGLTVVILNVFLSISQGITKQVADTVMQMVLLLFILMFAGKFKTKKERRLHFLKYISAILIVCIAFFVYYSNAMNNRLTADINVDDSSLSSIKDIEDALNSQEDLKNDELASVIENYASFSVGTERENSVFNKILPNKIKPMFNFLTSYFCHGYHGLSLAMEQDFESSYGLGFSDFYRHNISKLFGGKEFEDAIYAKTYMAKISDKGWPVGLYWPTFFVYPASDISFIGVIFLVFIIGFLFGLSWKDTILSFNPFALISFFGFCTMVFYFSANNQMFQTGESCIAFTVCIILWLLSRTILKFKNAQKAKNQAE